MWRQSTNQAFVVWSCILEYMRRDAGLPGGGQRSKEWPVQGKTVGRFG